MNDSVKQNEVKQVNRRSFLKGTAVVGAVAATSTIGAPAIHAGAHSGAITMKMQTSWPASNTWKAATTAPDGSSSTLIRPLDMASTRSTYCLAIS